MSGARDRVLAAVREGRLKAGLPPVSERPPGPPAPVPGSMIEQFSAALTALSGHVQRAPGPADVADIVAAIAREHPSSSFISWDEDAMDCPGLLSALSSRGLTRVAYDIAGDAGRRGEGQAALAGIGMGVTGAHAALADSGAIVLVSGPGRGRLASLLPPVHVAVVGERRLRASFAQLLVEEPGLLDAGSNVVLVAGPSRTADIEMTLTHGVHGPKHVHVILTP
jgi:L-lactate dehydrogenase complex protein LldG